MKRLAQLVLICAALAWCVPGQATCWGTNENGGPDTTTATVSISPNSGDLLYGFSRHGTNSTASITFTDAHNTWTKVGSLIANTGITSAAQMSYAPNAVAGTYTVTVTFGATVGFGSVFVCNLAGMATSSPLDGAGATCVNTTGATSCTSGTFTTTNANDVLVFSCTVDSTSNTFTAGAIGGVTATLRATSDNDAGTEDRTVSATQSGITARMVVNVSHKWICQAAAFKNAGGAAATAGFNKRRKLEQFGAM